jgi:outer membrane protein assembly factor BamB
MRRLSLLVVLACLAPASLITAAPATADTSSQPTAFPVVDGVVNDVLVDGDTAYVAGRFSSIGPSTGPMAFLDRDDASLVQRFPGIAGPGIDVENAPQEDPSGVYAAEPDGEGGLYVGGRFSRVDGSFRSSLVHLLPDGSVDREFSATVQGAVRSLALAGGELWVGGVYERVNGVERNGLAVVDAETGVLSDRMAWSSARVYDMDLEGDRLYLGGSFERIGGEIRDAAAAVDVRTGEVLDWDPPAAGVVRRLAARPGAVYLSRDASVIAVRPGDGSEIRSFSVGSGMVRDIVATDDVLVVSGYEDGSRRGIAAFDAHTGALLPRFADVEGGVALELAGTTLYASGVASSADPASLEVAAFDLDTGARERWHASGTGPISDIEVVGDRVVVAGDMRSVGAVRRDGLAAVDLTTNNVTGFDPGVAGYPGPAGLGRRARRARRRAAHRRRVPARRDGGPDQSRGGRRPDRRGDRHASSGELARQRARARGLDALRGRRVRASRWARPPAARRRRPRHGQRHGVRAATGQLRDRPGCQRRHVARGRDLLHHCGPRA